MKKLIIIIAIAVLPWAVKAQAIDMERMDRDIEIAKNILSTLTNEGRSTFFYSDNSEGNYLEGYGVILSMPEISFYLRKKGEGNNVAVIAPGANYSYRVSRADGVNSTVVLDKLVEPTDENSEQRKIEEKKSLEEADEKLIESMKIFLVDYADLIGQLQPNERIKVVARGGKYNMFIGNDLSKKSNFSKSAEILKSDLIEYKQGKITRDQTLSKVVVTMNKSAEKVQDLEIFSSIFSKLYEPEISQTYYSMRHQLNYEKLDDFGVIFNMQMYSSSSDNGLHTIRTTGESGLTQEERDKKVTEMYPAFELSLKENILDYGRTIKSLAPNEVIVFKVKLTKCEGCDMPKSIDVTVKASVLADYNSGKLSKNDAIEKVVVKKNK